jgi:heterodisulfide reductase subunit B
VNSKYGTKFNLPVLYVSQLIGLALGVDTMSLGLNTNIVSPKRIIDRVQAQGVAVGT